MSQSQKHLSRLKCLLSKRIVHAAIFLSQELHIDTDHALDQHSTLRRPTPHFIPLERLWDWSSARWAGARTSRSSWLCVFLFSLNWSD